MSDNNGDGDQNAKVAFVIFGVTGDLTHRKLIPALYELIKDSRLQASVTIVGFARREWSGEKLQEEIRTSLRDAGVTTIDPRFESMLAASRYIQASFEEDCGYQELQKTLDELSVDSVIFYLATPPDAYATIIQQIGKAGLNKGRTGWTRIVIEKPYGRDLDSALVLDDEVHKVFSEREVYRIDHYLGKETVQNILVLRFGNGIFEPLWNRRYVDHVQITVAETAGIGSRADYYDDNGVIRDMFQNHLLQLLTLTAMEAPSAFNSTAVRDEKVKVLKSLRPMTADLVMANTHRAQYTSGQVDGKRVPGYKDEPGVAADSLTETFLAVRLFVDNWRWAGVPFYLRSGKRLPRRVTEISIQFKQAPLSLFNWQDMVGSAPNVLALTLQPSEGICLRFGAKVPGSENTVAPVRMDFDYSDAFGEDPPPAYERLLLDVFQGDSTLFTRADEIQAQWAYTTEILKAWQAHPVSHLPVYESGTWGPLGVDEFIQEDGRAWRLLNMY